jgi:hypothetical protein
MMDPYIHIVRQDVQGHKEEKEPSSENNSSGYHALFAFEILRRPFSEFRGRAWDLMRAGHLFEAWDRQVHLIESLYLPNADSVGNPVFELRFIAYPDSSHVDLFLLGKAFATTLDQARSEATALSREMFSLFPFDFALRPMSSQSDFERAHPSKWLAGLEASGQIVEIRRFERLVNVPENGTNPLYLTHAWEWHLQSMDQVWCALAKYQQPLMFSISLSPILWCSVDYGYLSELQAVVDRARLPSSLALEFASSLKLYCQLLYQTPRPFTMRMVLAGTPAVPRGLANAVGIGLCLPSLQMGCDKATLGVNYTLAWPRCPADLSLAKLNLTQLSQYDWGAELVCPPVRRLRYAVNAREAQAAFRIPILPEGGFPDISLGHEIG